MQNCKDVRTTAIKNINHTLELVKYPAWFKTQYIAIPVKTVYRIPE
ncbi:MAG: hypothetical protein PHE08_10195 [Bacteroidales bacterium]|nr:hypothetical protein [Bacteroidales bacterium]MDD4148686.1 hypothetical protein [Bacteroidales bacterium]